MADEDWGAETTTTAAAPAPGGAPVLAELPEVKLFGKWSTDDVQVSDISLTVSSLPLSSDQIIFEFR